MWSTNSAADNSTTPGTRHSGQQSSPPTISKPSCQTGTVTDSAAFKRDSLIVRLRLLYKIHQPSTDVLGIEAQQLDHDNPVLTDHPVRRILRGEPERIADRHHIDPDDVLCHISPERRQPERLDLGRLSQPRLLI